MTEVSNKTKKRLLAVLITFTVLIAIMVVRLFWLQIIDRNSYKTMIYEQTYKSLSISPKRGKIFDRNAEELAINIPADTIFMNPTIVQQNKKDLNQMSKDIAELLKIDQQNLLKNMRKSDQYELILRKTDEESADKLQQWLKKNKIQGIYFTEEDKRAYPNKNLAAQLIGFTGIDNQGLYGIELSMEKYLLGQPGMTQEYVDASGQKLQLGGESRIDVQDGLNVVLTIDGDLQSFAEKALQKAIDDYKVLNGGVAIAMDPRNGEILAMVSKPDFDLNSPFDVPVSAAGIGGGDKGNTANGSKGSKDNKDNKGSQDNQNGSGSTESSTRKATVEELESKIWMNKAVSYTYEPGSTFKSVTASAALEEGIITPESEVVDLPVKVAGWTISSMTPGGHGKETFRKSVYNSDNPVFVKLAIGLGLDKFYDYVKAFGFQNVTGIDLPGEAKSIFQPKFTEIDMATASFGQSFQITPIQMITAYTAIENGGSLYKPQIVKELTDSKGNVVKTFTPQKIRNTISRQTSDTLRSILEGVVSEGTGKDAFIEGYKIAGKTGTSETFENGVRSKDRYVASFMGFAPADNPEISVLVLLDHPTGDSHYGGTVAAPVAASIIKYAMDNLHLNQ